MDRDNAPCDPRRGGGQSPSDGGVPGDTPDPRSDDTGVSPHGNVSISGTRISAGVGKVDTSFITGTFETQTPAVAAAARWNASGMEARRDELPYRQAVESIRDLAVIMLDPDGLITGWNAGAEAVLGYSRDEMLGTDGSVIFVEEDRVSGRPAAQRAAATAGGTCIDERWHRRRDGARLWACTTLNALRGDAGGLIGFVRTLRDQTAQREAARTLDEARAVAERASRSRNDFVATVSHELRTPLSIILMWSKMMRQGTLDGEELAEAIEAIGRSAESQSRLIEELLDDSRIASGKLRLDIGPADLGEIVTQVVDSFRPAMESKRIECVNEIDERAGVVECDKGRIQRVVRNLVANAVKFTPNDGRIEVGVHRKGDGLELSVADSGVGIEPAFLPKVFERFDQGDSTRDRPHGGLGLGLSIVRSIVEMHGGTVAAFSDGQGKGACLVVRLPMRSPSLAD